MNRSDEFIRDLHGESFRDFDRATALRDLLVRETGRGYGIDRGGNENEFVVRRVESRHRIPESRQRDRTGGGLGELGRRAGLMNTDEFDLAAARTRLKPRTLAAARAVLVDGLGMAESGRRRSPPMTRQQVENAVRRIEREHLNRLGAPHGWGCLTLVLLWNSDLWQQAERIESRAWCEAGLKKECSRMNNKTIAG